MLYLHDVWVNWFDGAVNSYNVYHFHEWRSKDGIELMDQIPVLYVAEDLFNYLENDIQEIPEELLESIEKRSYTRKGSTRTVVEHAFVATDGTEIIAIDALYSRTPTRKSRLIPRQEQLVYDMIKNHKPQSFEFDGSKYIKEYYEEYLRPEYVIGLTRKERTMRDILMLAIQTVKVNGNIAELRYWLTELIPDQYNYVKTIPDEDVWEVLSNNLMKGWNANHENICSKIIKGNEHLEKSWEKEQKVVIK